MVNEVINNVVAFKDTIVASGEGILNGSATLVNHTIHGVTNLVLATPDHLRSALDFVVSFVR